jgi:hypothetical protein
MSLILPHLHLSSLGLLTEALVVLMTGAVIGTDRAPPWAAAVADTHLHRTTITTTVAGPLVATAPAAMTIADAHLPASFMIGVKVVMDARRLVVACLMSMAHRARVTLTILMMLGPDLLPVVTMTHT